jgi:hypothetical protein
MELLVNPTIEEVQLREPWVYEHQKCGTQTVIDALEMHALFIDPYQLPYTYCAGCKRHFHDRQFVWVDSGENLYEYVKRIRAQKTLGFKLYRFIIAPLTAAIIGTAIGWFGWGDLLPAICGAVAGALFGWLAGGFVLPLLETEFS